MSTPRGLSSIQAKAMAVMFALVGALVVFLVTYFPAREVQASHARLVVEAATYARLVAAQVESAVAFDDRETVREVFTATAQDDDIRAIVLFDASGREVFRLGSFARPVRLPHGRLDRVHLFEADGIVRAVASVVSREGPTGTLVLDLTTERLLAERRALARTAALVGACALGFGFAAAWLVARSLGRRLRRIADATVAVAAGDLTVVAIEDTSADEVGQLTRSFDAMLFNLRALVREIRETGARERERLDALVRERTGELDARNRDLRLVLDNVDQGLLVLDRDGRPLRERSAAASRWFGEGGPASTFAELLGRLDSAAGASFGAGWQQVVDGVLPAEVALHELPRRAAASERRYALHYTPILRDRDVDRVLVVVSDVTERLEAERVEAETREILAALEAALRDRPGFSEFLDETGATITRLCAGAPRPTGTDVRRALHTVKGNASVLGLAGLAALLHGLEGAVDLDGDLGPAARVALEAHWRCLTGRLAALMGERSRPIYFVGDADVDALLRSLRCGASRAEITRAVARWKLEPAAARLGRLGDQARALAARLGKGDVRIVVDAAGVRVHATALAPLRAALTHAVRNAVSHGLEPPAERAAANKTPAGTLSFEVYRSGDQVALEISDDGRGVDWAAVRAKAAAAGLPATTEADLHAALFHDGLSTRDEADDLAGRGVGLGVLKAECERLGGTVAIRSARGEGTTLSLCLPMGEFVDVADVTAAADPRAARRAAAQDATAAPRGLTRRTGSSVFH